MAQTQINTARDKAASPQDTRVLRTYAPAVDIYETPDEIVLVADVPGARAEGIDVQFERGTLTINASVAPRRNDDQTNYFAREYGVGNYHRAFEINDDIDANRISAHVDNGVLTVKLPKAEAVKPRKIQVRSA
jgi:HSP20 family molecular chaperone IbpA